MVMRPDMVLLDAATSDWDAEKIATVQRLFSPRGRRLDQAKARDLAAHDHVLMVCGRYEGLDQRVIDHAGLEEINIGDVVLSGGEASDHDDGCGGAVIAWRDGQCRSASER